MLKSQMWRNSSFIVDTYCKLAFLFRLKKIFKKKKQRNESYDCCFLFICFSDSHSIANARNIQYFILKYLDEIYHDDKY